MASRAWAWRTVRGKPSSRTPAPASASGRRPRTMSTISLSGTRSPAAMIRPASLPIGVPLATSARRISPVDRCFRLNSASMRAAWVPFPLPGGPKMMPINRAAVSCGGGPTMFERFQRAGHGSARLGPRAVELRHVEKSGVLGGAEKGGCIRPFPERRASLDLDHARVEGWPAQVAGDRDSVMAIDHVIAIVDLVHVDGRQLIALDHRLVDAGPAIAHPAVDGKEHRVEIPRLGIGRDRAGDLVDRDLVHPAEGAALQSRCTQHRLDRPQPTPASGH